MSEQNVGLIFEKMSDVMRDIKAVSKDQKNQVQGYKFRGVDQFVNALYPALTKHKVFMTPRCTSYSHDLKDVTRSNGKPGTDKHVHILMEYDFFTNDGSKVTVGPIPGESVDSSDKSTNKALSAALKYALIQTFSVPTEDMAEADLESPTIGTEAGSGEKDLKELKERLAKEATGISTPVTPPEPRIIRKPSSFVRKPKGTSAVDATGVPAATTPTTADGWE